MDAGARVILRELSPTEIEPAVGLLARGMRDNPVIVRAFGANPEKRQRRLSRYYARVVPYTQPKGRFLGAFAKRDGRLIGVIGTLRPGCCQPRLLDVLRFVPTIVANNSPIGALRVKRWQDAWARHDPLEAHWHVGLVAVDADVQGLGIGTTLMTEHCARMDPLGATSYLETDKAINVRFYERFGFRVVRQEPVLGVTNWFMKRETAIAQRTDAAATGLPAPKGLPLAEASLSAKRMTP